MSDYYFCPRCEKIYLTQGDKFDDVYVASMKMVPLPRVVRGIIKESKLCRQCDKNETKNKEERG